MSDLRTRLVCLLRGHDYSCQMSRLCIGGPAHYCRRCGWNKVEYYTRRTRKEADA